MGQYQQLTQEKRYAIYVLLQDHYLHREIAKRIKVHHSTVSREIKRNTQGHNYGHIVAEKLSRERRRQQHHATKLTTKNKELIGRRWCQHWSPEQVSGRLKLDGLLQISHETIYKYIRQLKEVGNPLYKQFRLKKKYRKRRTPGADAKISGKVSIDERPVEVAARSRIGDWEVDTIVSRRHPSVLVSIVERYSRFTVLGKAACKQATVVARRIQQLLSHHHGRVLTITSDNGLEFARHRQISRRFQAAYYFCHPYCSWERGLNENTNGLIRHYAPKGSSFEPLDKMRVWRIAKRLNTRPRKVLGYRTPEEVYRGITPSATACG